jgi:drug/metabolite transporter (DMT)-like permease
VSYKAKLSVALCLVYIIWGSTYLGVRYAITVLPPLLLTGIRFGLGGSVLLLITTLQKRELPTKAEFLGSSFLGILLSGIGTSSVAYAIQYIPTGIVALLVAMLPLWVFVLDFFFFSKQRPSLLSGAGLLLGTIGIFWLLNPFDVSATEESIPFFPVFIVFVGSVIWGYGTLVGKQTPQAKGMQGIAIQMFAGGVIAMLASLFLEDYTLMGIYQKIDPLTVWSMVYLIGIGSYVGYTAFVWLMNNAPPVLASTYAFVNPVVALFLGWFFVNEAFSQRSLIASVIIIAAVVLMTLGRRRLKVEAEEELAQTEQS